MTQCCMEWERRQWTEKKQKFSWQRSWELVPNADGAMAKTRRSQIFSTVKKTFGIVAVNGSAWSTLKDYLQHAEKEVVCERVHHPACERRFQRPKHGVRAQDGMEGRQPTPDGPEVGQEGWKALRECFTCWRSLWELS